MAGNIYLIGGGEIDSGETKIIDDNIKQSVKKGSSFVFFPTAAKDADRYICTIESIFGDHFKVIAVTQEKGRAFAEDAIKRASVIYLGGGTTQLLLDLFNRWKLVPLLHESNERGTVIMGMSAGAQALCEHYIHEEDNLFELRDGWGIVPACCLVHATEDSFHKSQQLCSEFTHKRSKLIGIGEGASWCIDDIKEYAIGEGSIFLINSNE
jgi:peptidase E